LENSEFQELVLAQLKELTRTIGQMNEAVSELKDDYQEIKQRQHRIVEKEMANADLELNYKDERVYSLTELFEDINISRLKQGNPMEIQVRRYYRYKSFSDSQVQLLLVKLAEILEGINVTVTYEMNDITTRRKFGYRASGDLTEMEGDLQKVSVHFGQDGSYLSLRKVEGCLSYYLMLHSEGVVLANEVHQILENILGFQRLSEKEVFNVLEGRSF